MPKLDLPKLDYMPSYIAALREGYRVGIQRAKTEEEISTIENDSQAFLDDFFAIKTEPVTFPDGEVVPRVPQTKFWFMDGNEFLGEIGIRHELNHKLIITGGHMGYGVRPAYQGKGMATEMVRQALEFCRDTLGLDKVLITASETNPASYKVIEKNGGILENKVNSIFDGKPARRYWITL